MTGMKKHFICYCAFAPHIALALSLFLWSNLGGRVWDLAFYVCMAVVPLSFVFALISLHKPKNGRVAALATMLASDAHIILYTAVWIMSAIRPDVYGVLIPAIMVSLIFSGLALLCIWDNESVSATELAIGAYPRER